MIWATVTDLRPPAATTPRRVGFFPPQCAPLSPDGLIERHLWAGLWAAVWPSSQRSCELALLPQAGTEREREREREREGERGGERERGREGARNLSHTYDTRRTRVGGLGPRHGGYQVRYMFHPNSILCCNDTCKYRCRYRIPRKLSSSRVPPLQRYLRAFLESRASDEGSGATLRSSLSRAGGGARAAGATALTNRLRTPWIGG